MYVTYKNKRNPGLYFPDNWFQQKKKQKNEKNMDIEISLQGDHEWIIQK